jgi:hypothetical protein
MLICTVGTLGTKNKLFNWYQHDGTPAPVYRTASWWAYYPTWIDQIRKPIEGKERGPGEGRKEGLR